MAIRLRPVRIRPGWIGLLLSIGLYGQKLPLLPQDPPEVRWKLIRTPRFDIIYPGEVEPQAQRIANLLEQVSPAVARTLGGLQRRVPLVLHNQSLLANAYVGLGLRRAEWVLTPPQSALLGGNDWLTLLATHELRHVVQYDLTRRGLTNLIYYLTGELGWNIAAFLALPPWFWEGDAVGLETALNPAGRGRLPRFTMETRALILSRGILPYEKAHLRSLRELIPDHYALGYFLTTYVKRKFGPDAWRRIVTTTTRFPLRPFAFSAAIKKVTGQSLPEIYTAAMLERHQRWRHQLKTVTLTPAKTRTIRSRQTWTNYLHPAYLNRDQLLVLKYGLDDVPSFVILDRFGQETLLFRVGLLADPYFSLGNKLIVWSEITYDPRWGWRDYSTIKVHHLPTGKTRTLVPYSRLLSPAVSPDDHWIAAVEYSPNGRFTLVVLDARTGAVHRRIPSPNNDYLSYPTWSEDSRQIVLIRQNRRGRTIARVDHDLSRFTDLIPYTSLTIDQPVLRGGYLFFNSPFSGIDNIYAVDLHTRQMYQVTSRKFGSFYPCVSPDRSTLAYNDYSALGFDVVETPLDPATWRPVESLQVSDDSYYRPLLAQEDSLHLEDSLLLHRYPAVDYRPEKNLLKFHSWAPFYTPRDRNLSFSLLSSNLQNTLLLAAGLTYNLTTGAPGGFLSLSYQRWFPVIDLETRSGDRATAIFSGKSDSLTVLQHENQIAVGIRVPLNLTTGPYRRTLQVGLKTSLRHRRPYSDAVSGATQTLALLTYSFHFSRTHLTSPRDLVPPRGQILDLRYVDRLYPGYTSGAYYAFSFSLYLPGFWRHHVLRADWRLEERRGLSFHPATRPLPRGIIDAPAFSSVLSGAVNHIFPMGYPDLRLGGLIYWQRLKVNLFYDYTFGAFPDRRFHFLQSVGIELAADVNFLRFSLPVEPGIRFVWLPGTRRITIEFMLFGFARRFD
jgi:hypothetical protein